MPHFPFAFFFPFHFLRLHICQHWYKEKKNSSENTLVQKKTEDQIVRISKLYFSGASHTNSEVYRMSKDSSE